MQKFISLCLSLVLWVTIGLSPSHADDANTLKEQDLAFSDLSVKKGFRAAFDDFIVDDMVKLDAGRHPTIGKVAVLANLSDYNPNLTISWEPMGADISASEDLGYTWGIATITRKQDDGSIKTGYAKYITIWKKNSDGKWQVVLDGGGSNPGPWHWPDNE